MRRGCLPHNPLIMLHPLTVPGAAVPGREIVREIRTREGAFLYSMHWQVLSWSYNAENSRGGPERWTDIEREMLSWPDERLGQPLGLLAGYFSDPDNLRKDDVAKACLCISDWAIEHGLRGTATDFARVAALAWPEHAGYACIAGGILRSSGKAAEAEGWFRRAYRLAIWARDREAQVRALIGWADAGGARLGCASYAERICRRAVQLTERFALEELRGEALSALKTAREKRRRPGAAEEG
jgi:hypothetical protein